MDSGARPLKVFISHSARDKPAVEALARFLRAEGIDAWFDIWEIAPGDDVIARMNEGLDQADAGLIVLSARSLESCWMSAEVSSLTYSRIRDGRLLIPLRVGAEAVVPPLLEPLCWLEIADHQGIADALRHRRTGKPPLGAVAGGERRQLGISLERQADGPLTVTTRLDGQTPWTAGFGALPPRLLAAQTDFLRGSGWEGQGGPAAIEARLQTLGRELAALCLPAGAAAALQEWLADAAVGSLLEVVIMTTDAELLGLPFEALRLEDGRLLATQPGVVMQRRLPALAGPPRLPLPGPLKVLVAVGAPDEGASGAVVLDYEREFQNILDAVEQPQRKDNVEVRILEVGHPQLIAAAITRDAYHVLHLSCHGQPGLLELEDEDGQAVPTTAAALVQSLRQAGRPLPLVVLNSCHGGVAAGASASLAAELIASGIPAVLAMQTSVSDRYAAELARSFYGQLTRREPALASHALAAARQELEQERQRRLQQGAPGWECLPEAATAALYVAGEEQPLADFAADRQPLREPPVRALAGPVPQLPIGELVGRRRELRSTLRLLRDRRRQGGVVLTGIGGVGKSSLAGRAMQRLAEDGWVIAAFSGRFDPGGLAQKVGTALMLSGRSATSAAAAQLRRPDLDDPLRLALLEQLLASEPLLLVLDDFEQNLSVGGEALLDPDCGRHLAQLLQSAVRGRLLLTCRHPLPLALPGLEAVPLGPLSAAETRKLVLRLPGLCQRPEAEVAAALRRIGGHPRLLEFLDGLLRQGEGRLASVSQRLAQALAAAAPLAAAAGDAEARLQQVVTLGMRDVLLEELLAIARERGDAELLFQAAVSGLPTPAAGLARMLADAGDADDFEMAGADQALPAGLARLAALSLLVRNDEGEVLVHRWTAEGLARLGGEAAQAERCRRAGDYRLWRLRRRGQPADAVEALRNYLQGNHLDAAAALAQALLPQLQAARQTVTVAGLAAEVLERLPERHQAFGPIADAEAAAHLALGETERAFGRYRQLQERQERLVKSEPQRADYQRDLSVSYERMGDLYRALGEGEAAQQAYQSSLAIAERLVKSEPQRADYQRLLSVSYIKMGDLYQALGEGEAAQQAYQSSLAILLGLQQQGRLAPADQAILGYVQQMLAAADQA